MNIYKKVIEIIDFSFEIMVVLLISFIWSRYFIDDLTWVVIITIVLTCLIAFGLAKHKKIKDGKIIALNISNKNKEDFKNYFLYLNSKTIIEHIKTKTGGVISPNDDNIIFNNTNVYILIRKIKAISKDDILSYLQNLNLEKITQITILCTNIELECKNFLKNIANVHFEIEDMDIIASKYYSDILDNKILISNSKIKLKQNTVITFKMFLIMLLRPQNVKGYFFSAIILLFASIIVPQKLYYYIFASVLLLLTLLSKMFKK